MNLCPYCGLLATHSLTACPSVAEIEYFENGGIKRIVKRGPLDSIWRMPPNSTSEQGEAK